MSKHYIYCPFNEKDEAKALGARWDPEERKWYAVSDATYIALAKWHRPKSMIEKTIKKKQITGDRFVNCMNCGVPYIEMCRTLNFYCSNECREMKTRPWEQTGETQEIYKARQRCGSRYKGVWGGVPTVDQYKRMIAGEDVMFTAYDTRGD
tara:strand:- start:61 stop:513 length:453 start_codon:yes stop_codon:yes gene_type:complete